MARPSDHEAAVLGVLRFHAEPYRYLDDLAVHQALTRRPREYLDFVSARLSDLALGRARLEQPRKQIFADQEGDGDFRVMPCVYRDATRVVKTVKIVGTNALQVTVPDQITVGKALCLHPLENFVTHVLEACLLSSARTGLCAALSLMALAPQAERIDIVGAGRVGYYAGLFASLSSSVRRITFRDVQPERAAAAARVLGPSAEHAAVEALPLDAGFGRDAVVLATTAKQPIFSRRSSQAALIVSVGADHPAQRELDADLAQPLVFVDSTDSFAVGDLLAWGQRGIVPDAVELVELFGRRSPPAAEQRLVISTGSALMDNLSIGYLIERQN